MQKNSVYFFAVNCRFKYRTSVGMVFASAMQHESALLVSSWRVLNANGLLRFHLPMKFKIRGMHYLKEGQSLQLGLFSNFETFSWIFALRKPSFFNFFIRDNDMKLFFPFSGRLQIQRGISLSHWCKFEFDVYVLKVSIK